MKGDKGKIVTLGDAPVKQLNVSWLTRPGH